MTIGEDALARAMRNIRGYERQGAQAKCAGVHLEGPFVSYKKRGAQKAENIRMPDLDLFYRMSELSGGKLKIITMAPELEGALDFIREASKVCTVSLGHPTAGLRHGNGRIRGGRDAGDASLQRHAAAATTVSRGLSARR